MFVLAHLSDPHIPPLPEPPFGELVGKRATGYLNWKLRRGVHHSRAVLDRIIADLLAQRPDHIVVTGDLANLALETEFPETRKFLMQIGNGKLVSVVPGNHDAYVRATNGRYLVAWREYLTGDAPATHPFPFLRRRGLIAFVGLSTAVPTFPFFATGRTRLGADGSFRHLDGPVVERKMLPRCADPPPARRKSQLVEAPRGRR